MKKSIVGSDSWDGLEAGSRGGGFGKKERMILPCPEEAPGMVQVGASIGIMVLWGWAGRDSQDISGRT